MMNDHDKDIPKDKAREDREPVRKTPQEPAPEKRKDGGKPRVEKLPLGTGYEIEDLPTEVIKPEIHPLNDPIPDLVRAQELEGEQLLDEELPAPEDEFYDFDKDIYGDEAEIKPDL